jgi:hypothetical protein
MLRIRQQFERPRVEDVAGTIRSELEKLDLGRVIHPGQTVALTAGSRGIASIPLILRTVGQHLKKIGARPFIVPAMGSHGGGTAEGQERLLESYGITEQCVGLPIRATMEVVSLGSTAEGYPVVMDRFASEADHVGVLARIKPHTGYHGPIESGLLKMIMIGLGKHAGARTYHRILLEQPFDRVVRSVSQTVRARAPITFGLGLVENAYEETAFIQAVLPQEFEVREEELLTRAKSWMARLPFRSADFLVVDEIGKDISGSGMDTNIVGRKGAFRTTPPPGGQPDMRQIFVRGLSERTHGNAAGIGMADFTSTRLIRAMDYHSTVINCLTAGYPAGANLPVHFETDREAVDAALAIIGTREPDSARIIHIRNTLFLEEVEISEPCLAEPTSETPFFIHQPACEFAFDPAGNLPGI